MNLHSLFVLKSNKVMWTGGLQVGKDAKLFYREYSIRDYMVL